MADLELLTRKDLPAYFYVVTLEGAQYRLDFRYNERMGKWFLKISDPTGVELMGAVPITASCPLFNRFRRANLPPGTLVAFDSSGKNQDPGRFDLGDRVRLIYQESSA